MKVKWMKHPKTDLKWSITMKTILFATLLLAATVWNRAIAADLSAADKKKVISAFALSETGLKLLWQAKEECRDAGYFSARDGNVCYNDCATSRILIYRADDGSLLNNSEAKEAQSFGQFHIWGDRMVIFGDICHESIWYQCWYRSMTPGYKDLKATGGILYPRSLLPTSAGKYIGVCGYAELWCRPVFVDGYLFTRGVNKQEGLGTIFCWDLRALPEDKRVTAAKDAFAKGQKAEAIQDLIGVLKDTPRRPRADACRVLEKLGQSAVTAGPDCRC